MPEPVAGGTPSPSRRRSGAVGGLCRSRADRVLAGVCGGLGRSLGLDPVALRLLAVALGLVGVGVLGYLAAWLVVPPVPAGRPEQAVQHDRRHKTVSRLGAVLVGLGVLATAHDLLGWPVPPAPPGPLWALLPVVAGAGLMVIAAEPRSG